MTGSVLFCTDDISEDRLKSLWLEAHPPMAEQSDSSQERTREVETQVVVEAVGVAEVRGVGGEGEEGAAGGSGGEGQAEGGGGENEAGEGVEGSEEGERDKERGEGEEAEGKGEEGEEREVEGDKEEGGEGERVPISGGSEQSGEKPTVDRMAGFSDEPFVQAAAQFQRYELTGILELLTQAINRGLHQHMMHGCTSAYQSCQS